MSWEEKGFIPLEPVKESKYFYRTYIKIFDEDALQALKRELKKYTGLQQGHIEVHDLEALRIEDDYTHEAFNYTLVEHGYCLHRQEIIFTDADFVYYKVTKREVEHDEGVYEFYERVRFIFDTLHYVMIVRRQFQSDGGIRTLKLSLYYPKKDPVGMKIEKLLKTLR